HDICLSVVLTKSDLIQKFEEYHFRYFSGLIESVNANNYIHGSFIPVACGLQKSNIAMPLLFTLHGSVIYKLDSLSKEAKSHQSDAKYYEGRSKGFGGFWREMKDTWNGYITDKQRASNYYSRYYDKTIEVRSLEEPVKNLNYYIANVPAIKSNKQIYDYIEHCSRIGCNDSTFRDLGYSISSNPFSSF
ncbi:MAG: hypothetical protein AAFY76_06545, partial [Cyanobacteria bacterium J06649_11]